MRPAVACVFLAILATGMVGAAGPVQAAPLVPAERGCAAFLADAERQNRLPPGLLEAVALTESGQGGQPYPWALNIGGQPVMAASFQAAAALLRRADGRPRLDAAVGCMQIHMRYHLDTVETPEWVLEPRNNVWYAAGFLRQLFDQYGDWRLAVGHYNASDPVAQRIYVCQVTRSLQKVAPNTARDLNFPTDCASPLRRDWGGGRLASGRLGGGWGHVVVGVARPATAMPGNASAGKLVAVAATSRSAADGGHVMVVKPRANSCGTAQATAAGPLILRPGRCPYLSR